MKRKFAVIIISMAIILVSACTPSAQAIEDAIAKTQTALFTPSLTLVPTLLPPTKTPIPPTKTPQKTTYILETGWCMLSVTEADVNGKDPKTVQWCNLDSRQQIDLGYFEGTTITMNNLDGEIQVYCALFSLDGIFIMSDMDIVGSGKVSCEP